MRICAIVLLALCYVECRKIVQIDKNANSAFINMEGGGLRPAPSNVKPVAPTPAPTVPTKITAKPPTQTIIVPTPAKPAVPTPQQVPIPTQNPKTPSQITPKPVNPAPVANPITTPGPGSVKQLITFYDSQGKASAIRPYSYSQAVKQG